LRTVNSIADIQLLVARTDWVASGDSDIQALLDAPLTAEWDALARRTAALPFVRPQWVLAWWRAFAESDSKLALWYVRSNGRLAAVLPVMLHRGKLQSATNYHTPQSGVLAENDAAAQALVRSLLVDGGATEVVLAGLDSLGPDPAVCRNAALDAKHRTLVLPHERACFLDLRDDWTAYGKKLGKEFRAEMRRYRRRLEDIGKVEFDISTGGPDLPQLLDTAFAIEAAGWKMRNGTAIRAEPRVERFYADIARWAAAEDMLRLCFLRVGGRAVAMLLALEYRGKWHLLKTGYDERYQRSSPGTLLLHDIIHHCYESGVARIELHGDAQMHKRRWRPDSRVLQRFHMFPASLPGRVAWLRAGVRPWLKSLAVKLNLRPDRTHAL
jgi:CelD/BcsL family acetyltransferase involved in cellulose biosynthesis